MKGGCHMEKKPLPAGDQGDVDDLIFRDEVPRISQR